MDPHVVLPPLLANDLLSHFGYLFNKPSKATALLFSAGSLYKSSSLVREVRHPFLDVLISPKHVL